MCESLCAQSAECIGLVTDDFLSMAWQDGNVLL